MHRANFFLRTKLLPPRELPGLLPRPRLVNELEGNLQSPVTLVTADAGCGKTTLVADFVRRQDRPFVWYQLDHTDADPSVFLGYVVHGIRSLVPSFGEALLLYLENANEELISVPERASDLLINEILERFEQPVIIVLDDYHHIGRETVVHRIVDRLLQYASELLHLVITTRDPPPLAMMRRRAQSAAKVLTRDDLLFTDAEVRDLFKTTLGVELSPEQLSQYADRTHGWVTALQLVRQAAEQETRAAGNGTVDLGEMLKYTEQDIFDYFAEEVYNREPEPVRRFLTSLSLLDSLQLDVCSFLFPDLRCAALLPELAQKNVFLTIAGDGAGGEDYRFHPLFRDFLRRRLRSEVGKIGVAAEQLRIGERFLADGRWESSFPFLLDAGAYDRVAELIATRGKELITSGAFLTLNSFLKLVPPGSLAAHPHSLLVAAEVARIQGDFDQASALLQQAVASMRAAGDRAGEADARQSLASIARRRGSIEAALEHLDRAERLAAAGSEAQMRCANTRGLCLISQGKWSEAEQQFRFALEIAERRDDRDYQRLVMHNLALPAGFRGDFGEALRWFRRIFETEEGSRQLPQEAIGHLNVARLHLYRGEFSETLKHLECSLDLCQLFSLRSLEPEVLEAFANFYRDTGDASHAEEFYERATRAYEQVGIDIATRELPEERARFLMQAGDRLRARAMLERVCEARVAHGNEIGVRTARLGLAQIDMLDGRLDGLADRIAELCSYFQENHRYYDEALATLLRAEALFYMGRDNEAVPHVNRVLDLSARFDYDHWLRREMRRNPSVFLIEEVSERLPADLREELATAPGEKSRLAEVLDLSEPPPVIDLTVKVLGPVEIFRDPSTPFAPDAWTTRRARDIFCFIATSKRRQVSKELLIDTFWSDEDLKSVEKNFHPTISHIRKALNSRQLLKRNFIIFRDGAYGLNPELAYSIDTEQFGAAVAEAESAKRDKANDRLRDSLTRAYDLYRGEYMSGVYEDWAAELREHYAEQFARVTGALAKLSLAEGRAADAHRFADESLKLDPYREDMHRLLIRMFAAQGKAAAAKKHYEAMKSLLKIELGVDPSPETRRLAAELGLQG